jgi:Ca-activated chloride channel family protein
MNFTEFEFANPPWLWALLIPLFLIFLAKLSNRHPLPSSRIRNFADAHLLPHLLINPSNHSRQLKVNRKQLTWLALWILGILALAGPRWDYQEQTVVRAHANLLILLDLSESMRVEDLPHSRFEQAVQEVEELLSQKEEVFLGLMVFAGMAHWVSPLTDDSETLRHLLYELKVDMLPIQGSRLSSALDLIKQWLIGQKTTHPLHVVLISDGEFEAADLETSLNQLSQRQFYLHTLGVGTSQGDFIPVKDGNWQRNAAGEVVISKLNEDNLRQLAAATGGIYRHADYHNEDTKAILEPVKHSIHPPEAENALQKLWHERFYLLVGIMVILILPWFRRRQISPA